MPGNLRICSVSCQAATCHWTYVGAIPEKKWAAPPAYSRRRSRIALACSWSRSSPRDMRGSTFVPPKMRLEQRPTRPSSPSMVWDYLFLENTAFIILQLRFITFYLVPCTDLANSTIVIPSFVTPPSRQCCWILCLLESSESFSETGSWLTHRYLLESPRIIRRRRCILFGNEAWFVWRHL